MSGCVRRVLSPYCGGSPSRDAAPGSPCRHGDICIWSTGIGPRCSASKSPGPDCLLGRGIAAALVGLPLASWLGEGTSQKPDGSGS